MKTKIVVNVQRTSVTEGMKIRLEDVTVNGAATYVTALSHAVGRTAECEGDGIIGVQVSIHRDMDGKCSDCGRRHDHTAIEEDVEFAGFDYKGEHSAVFMAAIAGAMAQVGENEANSNPLIEVLGRMSHILVAGA